MKLLVLSLALVLPSYCGTCLAANQRTPMPELGKMTGVEAEAFYIGLNAVIWGYPMVKFEELMRARTKPNIVKLGNPQAAVNQFGMVRELRGPDYKQIATPNNDTLYAQAFCDVSREPLVLTVPKVDQDRYYGMQLWDPNGDTFAYVGTRTTGHEAGNYALVGPGWNGTLSVSVKRINAPYNSFVIWGRIGVKGGDDLANALAIQDQLRLVPLSRFEKASQPLPPDLDFSATRVELANPQNVKGDLLFFVELANALKHTPPRLEDAVITESLSQIGFKDNNTFFDAKALNEGQRNGLSKALQFGLHLMDIHAQTAGESINGWRWSPKSGKMGNDYLFRATFAKWFTGGNAPEEAIYMDNRQDESGRPYDGRKRYRIHFNPGQLPPARAFWSLSMYNLSDGSFVANPIGRYSIGDRTPGMQSNADGSLDIYIQNNEPKVQAEKANWLPAPKAGFYLNLRIYVPDDKLQNGQWQPPVVRAIAP